MKRLFRLVWTAGIVLLGYVATLGGATGCSGEECLSEGHNCSDSYLESHDMEGASCCDDLECCYLPNGISVPTCEPSHRCE